MPESLPENYVYSFPGNFEEINLKTPDGARLNAVHFKLDDPKGVILYFHGNAGELASWGLVVQKFVKMDYDVLVMDFRSYGKSTGEMNEKALYDDAQLFYDLLLKKYPEDEITVYGRSLGTTFATYVAAFNTPKQLILEAPLYSLEKIAQERFPFFPVSWVLKYEFPTYEYLKNVSSPILIFHGTEDRVVNYRHSEELSKIKTKGKLDLITVPRANHRNLVESELYKSTLDSIL